MGGNKAKDAKAAAAELKAKAKGKAKAKAKAKTDPRKPSRGPKKPATPGEEGQAAASSGRKPKLYCKTFLETGSCKNPECAAAYHATEEQVQSFKAAFGDNLQLYYNPPKHKAST